MKSHLFQQLKPIIYSLRDQNGNTRTLPIGIVADKKCSKERIEFFQDFIKLFLDTNYTCEVTKLYLCDRHSSMKSAHEEWLDKHPKEKLSIKTTQNKILNDQSKGERNFGVDVITDVLDPKCDIDEYKKNLASAYAKLGGASRYRNMTVLNIPSDKMYTKYTPEFNDLVASLRIYLKSHIDSISSSFTDESIGYFNYLFSSPYLSETDKVHRNELLKFLDPDIADFSITDPLISGEVTLENPYEGLFDFSDDELEALEEYAPDDTNYDYSAEEYLNDDDNDYEDLNGYNDIE